MSTSASDTFWRWVAAGALLALAVALGLRYGTNVLDKGELFDERFIRVPIDDLIERGWSIETAIDFEETKGPTLVWTYALLGAVVGESLEDLRLVSIAFFVLGVVPLMLVARWCGIEGPRVLLVALLYILMPYQALLGQLLMSEASFMFGSLWLLWIFCWGFGDARERGHRVAGPVIFGIVLSLLLHHRIHAVAFAAAAVLVATERDRAASWPWWVAAALAGLSRVPLWVRWDGLVSPSYQSLFGTGFGLQPLTYLAAAFIVFTGILLWPGLTRATPRSRWLIAAGAVVGLGLGLLVPMSLGETLVFGDREQSRFLGIVTSVVERVEHPEWAQATLIAAMAAIGLASMGALAAIATGHPVGDRVGVVMRLVLWSFLTGWGMYAFTQGHVFDRYVAPWAALLPVVLVLALRRPALAAQLALWLGIAAYMVGKRLIW